MAYKVELTTKASKTLRLLEPPIYRRVRVAIDALAENPRPNGCLLLKVEKRYRIRVGDYRIVYEIEDDKLLGSFE